MCLVNFREATTPEKRRKYGYKLVRREMILSDLIWSSEFSILPDTRVVLPTGTYQARYATQLFKINEWEQAIPVNRNRSRVEYNKDHKGLLSVYLKRQKNYCLDVVQVRVQIHGIVMIRHDIEGGKCALVKRVKIVKEIK